jgi:hypothetical protein
MDLNKSNNSDNNSFNGWLEKWKSLNPAPPRRDSFKAICWLAALGALLHPVFAFLPGKLLLLVMMDGFLLLNALIIAWHERDARKN